MKDLRQTNMSAKVPNVKPKSDPEEAARIHAEMEILRRENAQIISGEAEEGKEVTLEERLPKVVDGVIDLRTYPTVFFKGAKNGTYIINHQVAKIFIEGCENLTVIVNNKILSSTVEAWRNTNLSLRTLHKIETMQLDLSKDVNFGYKSKDMFGCVVWQGVTGALKISFEEDSDNNLETSFDKMLAKHPDSSLAVDQFMIRFVEQLGDGLQEERCVRLKNGFLSTEREADEWDKRNTLAKERYMENFLKESGIRLNKKEGKKIQPNAVCPKCDSGKKYKKCCMNKKELTGVVPRNVPTTGSGGAGTGKP